MKILFLPLFLYFFKSHDLHAFVPPPSDGDYALLYPKLCIGLHVLETEYTLPYFMGMLEEWRYPKDRILITFFAREDSQIVRWVNEFPVGLYSSITSSKNNGNWREQTLSFGRRKSCNLLLLIDTNAFLLRDTIRQLISFEKVVISPLIISPFGTYSNAQSLMLGDEFERREKLDFVRVYYSNGPLLINLKHIDSSYLTFESDNLPNFVDQQGTGSPINVFATSAFAMNIPIVFSNHFNYGYFIDSSAHSRAEHMTIFSTFLANWVSDAGPMPFPVSTVLEPWYPIATKLGFDEVYLINLERRSERLAKMQEVLSLVGIQYKRVEAVDGHNLTQQQISSLKFLPSYTDPFHKRPMKLGEIGCFLSHFKVWEDILRNGYERAIVLEDDVRFTPNGTLIIKCLIEDMMKTRQDWDFIYLGRKKMTPHGDEFFVPGHRFLSTVAYSYWTLGYAISAEGAKKLLAARPLDRLMALDEFLPIMYDQHPNHEWSAQFEPRNLHAFAAYPVAVQPERYTHEPGYVSDTEASPIIESGSSEEHSLGMEILLSENGGTAFGKDEL